MLLTWSTSEKLRLLLLHKGGVTWPATAEKMNEVYKERPVNFFNEQTCNTEFDRILKEPCPKPITPNEPSQPFKIATVIDAWIDHLRGKMEAEYDTRIETTLVDFRKKADLIERLMSKDNRPSMEEMRAMLEQITEEHKQRSRSAEESAHLERVISVLRSRIGQIFKERREANNDANMTLHPGALSIAPTKPSSIALQNVFRSPSPNSPITSPIRPLAETIEEEPAVLGDGVEEEMEDKEEEPEEAENEKIENEEAEKDDDAKMEVDTPVASPLNRIASPIAAPIASHIPSSIASPIRSAVSTPIRSPIAPPTSDGKREKEKSMSPRTAADRAIGDGGLEEEMEEEEKEEAKEESMEVDERKEGTVGKKKEEMPEEAENDEFKNEDTETDDEAKKEVGVKEKVEKTVYETEEMKEEPAEEEEQQAILTRKSTPVKSMIADTTPVSIGGKEKMRKDPSPIESTTSKKEEKENKEELKAKDEEKTNKKKKETPTDEEPPVRRVSMRGRPSSTHVVVHSAPSHSSKEEKKEEKRVEKVEEKEEHKKKEDDKEEEEKGTPRRRSIRVEKMEEKKEGEMEKKKEDDKKEETKDTKSSRRSIVMEKEDKTEETEKEKEVKEEVTFAAPTVASRTRQHKGSEQSDEKKKEKSEEPIGSKTRSSGRLSGKSTSESKEFPAPPERRTRRGEKKGESEENESEREGGKETSVTNTDESPGGGGRKDVQTETEVSIHHNLAPTTPMSPPRTRRGTERASPVARKASRASSCSSTNGKPSMASVEVQTDEVEFSHDDVVHYKNDDNEQSVIEIDQRGRGRPRKIEKEGDKEIKTEAEEEMPISRRTRGGEASEVEEGPSSAKKKSLQGGRRSMVHMDPHTRALYNACTDLDSHRHSRVFQANVSDKDVPEYSKVVHFPMSLSKLKSEVCEGIINNPVSLQRKLQIMYMNGTMYNSTEHDYWKYADDMGKETFKTIKEIMFLEEEEAPRQKKPRRNEQPPFAKNAVYVVDSTT